MTTGFAIPIPDDDSASSGTSLAADVDFTPAGNIAATDVQAAIVELDTEKQPTDPDLTAIAGLDSSTAGAIASDGAGWIKKTYAQFKTALSLVKGDVGLGNVDNTSDANKPVSTAQQAALDLKQSLSGKGVAGGYAELDGSGFVPSAQLPSFVDDVIEAANFAALPGTGATGKIYVTLDDGKTYRWSGSAYVEISASLALGETSTTAYRGDRGKTAYDHSQLTSGNPHNVTKSDVGLGNADNTSDVNKPVSTATQAALDLKSSIAPRVGTTASSATPTPNADAHDQYNVTALAAGATFGAPTGTPSDGQRLILRVKDNGTARSLAFNAIYRAIGVTLPTTTVVSKTLYLGARYNAADSKWDVLATAQEA